MDRDQEPSETGHEKPRSFERKKTVSGGISEKKGNAREVHENQTWITQNKTTTGGDLFRERGEGASNWAKGE